MKSQDIENDLNRCSQESDSALRALHDVYKAYKGGDREAMRKQLSSYDRAVHPSGLPYAGIPMLAEELAYGQYAQACVSACLKKLELALAHMKLVDRLVKEPSVPQELPLIAQTDFDETTRAAQQIFQAVHDMMQHPRVVSAYPKDLRTDDGNKLIQLRTQFDQITLNLPSNPQKSAAMVFFKPTDRISALLDGIVDNRHDAILLMHDQIAGRVELAMSYLREVSVDDQRQLDDAARDFIETTLQTGHQVYMKADAFNDRIVTMTKELERKHAAYQAVPTHVSDFDLKFL